MNIVYSSDENYIQHLAVSLVSLLENNQQYPEINIYIISNGVSESSKQKLLDITQRYQRNLVWIDFEPFRQKININMSAPIAIASYARLFIAQMVPETCRRALYLDCDTVVLGSVQPLFEMDMKACSIGGVKDFVKTNFKEAVGLQPNSTYVNAGVLLIDVEKWRQDNQLHTFLKFIEDKSGSIPHHDQGVINGTLNTECLVLPPQYNLMTPAFTTQYRRLLKFYELTNFYSEDELRKAVDKPVIIHCTPEFAGRVWEKGCKHPMAGSYLRYLEMTPWKGNIRDPKPLSLKLKLIYFIMKNFPMPLVKLLLKFAR